MRGGDLSCGHVNVREMRMVILQKCPINSLPYNGSNRFLHLKLEYAFFWP